MHAYPRETCTGEMKRMTNCPGSPGTVLILTFEVSYLRKPLSLGQTKRAGHPGKEGVWEHKDVFLEGMTPMQRHGVEEYPWLVLPKGRAGERRGLWKGRQGVDLRELCIRLTT